MTVSLSQKNTVFLILSRVFLFLAFLDLLFLGYCVLTGFPPEVAGLKIRLKNARTPFIFFFLFMGLSLLSYPGGVEKLKEWKGRILRFASRPYAVWLLFGIYTLLFTWQQVTEYLALEINFIPFSFYDYMLYFFFQGKVNYTGLLHGFYHVNNILYLLAPFWYFLKSPLLLIGLYGLFGALAIFPLYGIAREKFQEPLLSFVTAFVYLNYRYLQNVLLMNFSVEIFYPLFIFASLYFAMKEKWLGYYCAVLLGLSVKEDSFMYFAAVGVLVFFIQRRRVHGIVTLCLSLAYLGFLVNLFMPLTGSDMWRGNLANFAHRGRSFAGIAGSFFAEPASLLEIFFGSPLKWKTYFNLLYWLGFLPLFSPAVLLVFFPLFPLFLHHTGRDWDFYELHFHYAAAVIPFIFIAFIFGYSNITKRLQGRGRELFLWMSCLVLVLINGGRYTSRHFTTEDLKSIQWAKSIPPSANLVTHGHLLPHIGYRKYNYYFAPAWENEGNEEGEKYEAYANADYYLIDFNVNPYPVDRTFLEEKLDKLSRNPYYEIVRQDDKRYLFKRRVFAA
jgi:uncharacterized membrane protein